MPTFSYYYSIPYISIFLLLIVLAYVEIRVKNEFISFVKTSSTIIFFMFIGFRGYIGWDWYSYIDLFEKLLPLGKENQIIYSKGFMETFSPLFILFIRLFKFFSNSFLFFTTLISFISVLFFRYFFKYYNVNVSLGFALIIAFGLGIQIDLLRNNLSIILFLFSIKYVNQGNPKKYFITNLIGAFFHLSSFVFLPLYFFLNKNFNKKFYKLLVLIGVPLYFIKSNFVDPLVAIMNVLSSDLADKFLLISTINSFFNTDINYPYLIVKLFFAYVVFKYYNVIVSNDKRLIPFLNLTLLNIYSFLFLSGFSVIQSRIQLLFIMSFIITIPYVLKNIKHSLAAFTFFVLFQVVSLGIRYKVVLFSYENYLFTKTNVTESKTIFDNHAYIIKPLEN